MTLDEAITHAREIAQRGGECAKDHEQLAEWLEELRKLKTITATLGSGTCRLDETESYPSERGMVHVLECSNCGRECEHVNGDYEHCPHCLARNELF